MHSLNDTHPMSVQQDGVLPALFLYVPSEALNPESWVYFWLTTTKYTIEIIASDWLTHCSLHTWGVFLSQNFDSFSPTSLKVPSISYKQPKAKPLPKVKLKLQAPIWGHGQLTMVRDSSSLILSLKMTVCKSRPKQPEAKDTGGRRRWFLYSS